MPSRNEEGLDLHLGLSLGATRAVARHLSTYTNTGRSQEPMAGCPRVLKPRLEEAGLPLHVRCARGL